MPSSTSSSSRTALLFWTRVIYSPPWRSPLSEIGRLVYLGSTLVVRLGAGDRAGARHRRRCTRAYSEEASRPGHISALTDQQLAAGVMWVPGSLAYTIALVVIAYRWLEPRNTRGRPGTPAKALPTGVG